MPLSEDEQRILQNIERSFYESDPAFAQAVTDASLYRHAGRNCKIAAGAFIASLLVLLVSFTRIPIVGFAGFVGMVVSGYFFERNLRRIGRAGLHDLSTSERIKHANESVAEVRREWRQRFRRRQ